MKKIIFNAPAHKNETPCSESPRRARRSPANTAMALVGIMLALMLVLAIGLVGIAKSGQSSGQGDLGSTSNNALQMTTMRIRSQKAETIADAGFRAAVEWISDLGSPPINVAAFTPLEVTPNEFYAGSGRADTGKWTVVSFPNASNAAGGTFKVRFYPHKDNASAAQRQYLVEVVGTVEGTTRVVRADIRQKNFAQYAYFTDNLGPGAFVAGRTPFNGPVHINNSNGKDLNVLWESGKDPAKYRLFQWDADNTFTMWKNGSNNATNNTNKVKWHQGNFNNNTAPTSDSDWKDVIAPKVIKDAAGNPVSETVRTGPSMTDDKINLPKTSYEQRDAALGGFKDANVTANGVYVPSTGGAMASGGTPIGGVYIKGRVEDMVMEAAGPGDRDQIIHVYQGTANSGSNIKVRYDLRMNTDGTTSVNKFTYKSSNNTYIPNTSGGYPKNFSGAMTNGVIYSYDDIGNSNGSGGISGTVANSETDALGEITRLNKLNICTRIETGNQKTISIDGNILYANATGMAAVAEKDSAVLGLVAGNIRIVQEAEVKEAGVTGFEKRDALGNIIKDVLGKTTYRDGYYADAAKLTDLAVHATMMSYNSIKIDAFDSRPKGQFRLLGGYIAQIGSSFGQAKGGDEDDKFDVKTGFERILSYDKRVANQPPPYFPGTDQAYEIVSYQRLLAPLYP